MTRTTCRVFSLLVAIGVAAGLLGVAPAVAGGKASAVFTVKQVGSDLVASWKYRNAKPVGQSLVVTVSGKLVRTVKIPAKMTTTTLKGLSTGVNYTLTLKATKPTITTSWTLMLRGVPVALQQVMVVRDGETAVITWATPPVQPDSYVITTEGSNGVPIRSEVPGSSNRVTLTAISATETYTFVIAAQNSVGIGPATSVRLVYQDQSVLDGVNYRVFDQASAAMVIGPAAVTMRPATGPVDLDDPSQAAQNLVMAALHNCLTTAPGRRAEQATLPHIGAVYAARSASETLLLTSGAMGIRNVDGAEWLAGNEAISACVQNPLTTQLINVATALSPLATVSNTSVAMMPTVLPGTVSALATGSVLVNGKAGGVEQPLQILWVGIGSGNYLAQYVIIRFGATIDSTLVSALRGAIAAAHTSR